MYPVRHRVAGFHGAGGRVGDVWEPNGVYSLALARVRASKRRWQQGQAEKT